MTATATEPFRVISEDTSRLPRADWLDLRRPYIGSSDGATTLGLNPWDCAYRLMAEKKGVIPDRDETEHMKWGRLVEPVILDEWERRHAPAAMTRHSMAVSEAYPFMASNPDALTSGAVVEAKTADRFDRVRWDDGVPDHYVIQGTHHMIVWGRERCVYPVLFGGNEYVEYEVDYDESIAAKLIEAEAAFAHRVATTDWPDPDGSESSMLALRARYLEWTPGVAVELDESRFGHLLTLRAALAEQASSATKQIDAIKALVMETMGTAERATVMGETVATWRATKAGTRRFTWTR